MSCDNIPHNGVVARSAVAGLARMSDAALFEAFCSLEAASRLRMCRYSDDPYKRVQALSSARDEASAALAGAHYGALQVRRCSEHVEVSTALTRPRTRSMAAEAARRDELDCCWSY